MDGVIVINKEEGMTSHDVVAKLRHIFGTRRIGHTGTLDPIATGVLVVCVERATKLVDYLTCEDKIYEVEMKFGEKTDTGDRTGNLIARGKCRIDSSRLDEVIKSFIGKQKQIPPMYSAIKVKGKKLYEYARKGIKVEREPRDIEIFSIENVVLKGSYLSFKIHCSKGTYIRTVCEDIADKFATVGTMTKLNRVRAGMFDISDAVKVDDACEDKLIKLDKLFDNEIIIKNGLYKLINGMPLYFNIPDGMYRLYTDNYVTKKFIGLGKIKDKYLYRVIIL